LVLAYGITLCLLAGCAGGVALFVGDADRRKTAYDVLKLVLTTTTGAAGLVGLLVRLHDAGLV
jgi:hypothetical protein